MPVRKEPKAGSVIGRKRVTPDELMPEAIQLEDGTYVQPDPEEWIEIKDYLPDAVIVAARKAATTTITQGTRVRDEWDGRVFTRYLLDQQVTAWSLIDADTMLPLDFTPDNLHALPWDMRDWLAAQIQSCGGVVATRGLVLKTNSPQVMDFRDQNGELDTGDDARVLDPSGGSVLSTAGAGATHARNTQGRTRPAR